MTMKFSLEISYNQLSVFDATLESPFNDWEDAHVRQGFAWRDGSVAFGMTENAETDIDVSTIDAISVDPGSVRAIIVPFEVPGHERVVIGSVGSEKELKVTAGHYELLFETGDKNGRHWAHLYFVQNDSAVARIVKADAEIDASSGLLMTASPAV